MSSHAPSPLQQAVIDTALGTRDNLLVQAGAGCAKTTTIEMVVEALLTKHLPVRLLVLAYNKAIVAEMKQRLPATVPVMTTHSWGNRALLTAYPKLRNTGGPEGETALKRVLNDGLLPLELPRRDHKAAADYAWSVISMAKNTLTDIGNQASVLGLCQQYGIRPEAKDAEGIQELVLRDIAELHTRLQSSPWYGFDDQLYRPATDDGIRLRGPSVILVDECQDLNRAQLRMLERSEARVIAVGDPHQAIYGFRGAAPDAVDQLRRYFNMVVLPLSVTYRCPVSHVRLVNRLVPELEPRPGAEEGVIEEKYWGEMLADGDLAPGETLIIARCNAPLVGRCLDLIRQGIPATIRGRDVSQAVVGLVARFSRGKEQPVEDLLEDVDRWFRVELRKLARIEGGEAKVQALQDRVATLQALADGCTTVGEILERCRQFFSGAADTGDDVSNDQRRRVVELATVHGAKGLEATTVIILEPWKLPLQLTNAQPWEVVQEQNVEYVAKTRGKHRLIFEGNPQGGIEGVPEVMT